MLTRRRLLSGGLAALLWPWRLWAQPLPPSNLQVGANVPATFTFVGSINNLSLDSASQAVTVDASATIFLVGVSGYISTTPQTTFSSGTITLGGAAPDIIVASDASAAFFKGALFAWLNPPTGSQTLAWDWVGTGTISNGVILSYGYVSEFTPNTSTPTRDTFGLQDAASPHDTDTMTAQTGDFLVAWVEQFVGGARTFSWTNATLVADETTYRSADGGWASASPTGDVVVTATVNDTTGGSDGGIMAIVFIPAAAAGWGRLMSHTRNRFVYAG